MIVLNRFILLSMQVQDAPLLMLGGAGGTGCDRDRFPVQRGWMLIWLACVIVSKNV